jgi:hypothetical protein
MKTPEEIRRHRDDLLAVHLAPCNCRGTAHQQECRDGGLMAAAAANVLSRALGENDDMEAMVQHIHARVAEIRESN